MEINGKEVIHMASTASIHSRALTELTGIMLRELRLGIHRQGYKCLVIAVPLYAADSSQSLSKGIYPLVAAELGCSDWHAVERAIRLVILDGWAQRDGNVWARYFPGQEKMPTNKQFIAALAERLR